MIGRYKYVCLECEEINFLTSADRASRFQPRCVNCGSTVMDPVPNSIAKTEIAKAKSRKQFDKARWKAAMK